ncbi:hypothetical protein [Hyphomonas sp.]|uniref:hypothetical protein n=1 Tax=Hyphomonas sp. TaxID=87 RepID=UPI0033409683
MLPTAPIRAPHYIWDDDGPAAPASARFLLGLLCGFVRLSPVWKDRAGRGVVVTVERGAQEDACIILGGALEGHIEPKPLGPADVHPGRAWFGRGWTQRC